MDFDDQLRRYFGISDLAAITPAALAAGTERLLVDFGLETPSERRLRDVDADVHVGVAPEIDVAVKCDGDRDVARNFPRSDGTVDEN